MHIVTDIGALENGVTDDTAAVHDCEDVTIRDVTIVDAA